MIPWAPLVRTSVLTGQGVEEAMELVVEAGRWRRERLPKAPLNDVFQDALMIRPLPRTKTGGLQKLRYALQLETGTQPPPRLLAPSPKPNPHPQAHHPKPNPHPQPSPYP